MSRTPIIRPISWPNAAINLLVLFEFVFIGWRLHPTYGVVIGAAVYLVLSYTLRGMIARDHRGAIAHCKREEFQQAIPRFQNSLAFFERHPWVDRLRAITMLSAAGMSYREMALVSLAFCYAQIGDGKQAREYYDRCLNEFPNNGMAKAALRLMDAACQPTNAT